MKSHKPVAPYVGAWIETSATWLLTIHRFRSHPTWVRGLKLALMCVGVQAQEVAPYVGAWIETIFCKRLSSQLQVAPYVGAWIETLRVGSDRRDCKVAPYVGAWIETCAMENTFFGIWSHPTWVRGLKLFS